MQPGLRTAPEGYKQEAIKTLSVGTLGKVFLPFKSLPNTDVFNEKCFIILETDTPEQAMFFVNLKAMTGKNLLIRMIVKEENSGDNLLSDYQDSELVAASIKALQEAFGRDIEPDDVENRDNLVFNPAEQPYMRGAYCAFGFNCSWDHLRSLGKTEGDSLFFAGEATQACGAFASVDGAMNTGTRAAKQVCQYLQGLKLKRSEMLFMSPTSSNPKTTPDQPADCSNSSPNVNGPQ